MKRYISIYFILIVLFPFSQAQSQEIIEHCDPPNWWVGMHHSDIQLMVHGEDIGKSFPSVNYKGVRINSYTSLENSNYLFIDISIAPDTKPGEAIFKFEKNGKEYAKNSFPILARTYSAESIQGFDTRDVMYLITPDRFANGNPENDELPSLLEKKNRAAKCGRHGGDIKGISDHLDYIKDLGFTSIWLNPVLENDMEDNSYHGYSTTDFYKVDPRYGSNAEYQKMSRDARQKDIKLIMDMIVNHCGLNHWWMKDLPSEDWINNSSKYIQTNHRKTVWQDPYVSQSDKKQMADGWFVPTMPDMNQRNPFMAKYLLQNSIWWIEYLGLAGIRMDTYPYPEEDYMTEWTREVMAAYPNFSIVGEEWNESPNIVAYWQRGKENANGYVSDLTHLMDFPVQMSLSKALTEESGWTNGLNRVYTMIAHDFVYADPMNLVIFPDNHDMSRIFSQMNEDYDLYKMSMVFYATFRGTPQYYYGTEILMKNPGTNDHCIIRSDFPGGWEGDEVNGFTGDGLSDQEKDAKEFTSKLLNWRKTQPVIHNGSFLHFIPQDDVYVYFRYDDKGNKVMVAMNKNQENKIIDLSRFDEILKGEKGGNEILTGKYVSFESREIEISKRGVLLVEVR